MKQATDMRFVCGTAEAWLTPKHAPCGLRKAIKQAFGTTLYIYQQDKLIKTLDVLHVFIAHLEKLRAFKHLSYPTDEQYVLVHIKIRMRHTQDQNNRLLQKIRKLTK